MSAVNPLAYERLRTLVADAVTEAHHVRRSVTAAVMGEFPDVHFEYRTNRHGVAVRRVAATTEWEVDPDRTASAGPDHSPGAAGVLPGVTCPIPDHCPPAR